MCVGGMIKMKRMAEGSICIKEKGPEAKRK
jgi:hypothetical protein